MGERTAADTSPGHTRAKSTRALGGHAPVFSLSVAPLLSSPAIRSQQSPVASTSPQQATDTSDNSASCTATVTVKDEQPPRLPCLVNVTAVAESGRASAAVAYSIPEASDNVGVDGVVCSPVSGTRFGLGSFRDAIACSAFDAAGNVASCTFGVVVVDEEAPRLACSNVTVATRAGERVGELAYTVPAASDNAPGPLDVACTVAPTAVAAYDTATAVSCSTADAAGNEGACVFYVRVEDQEAPQVTCPADVTVQVELGQNGTTAAFGSASASDNSGEAVEARCTAVSGAYFEIGVHTVRCESFDGSGNRGECSFEVDALDPRRPTVVCPAAQALEAGAVSGTAVATWPAPAARDFFGASVSDVVCTPASGTAFEAGSRNVTCVATDSVGRQGSCVFGVAVADVTAPVLACPDDVAAEASALAAAANVSFPAVTAVDNADGSGVAVTCTAESGGAFGVGRTTVSCGASDAAGNEGRCSFSVTVADTTAPVVTCPGDRAATTDAGLDTAALTLQAATASDNVGVVALSCDASSGLFGVGERGVRCSASDAAGNVGSCSYTVAVSDGEAPTVRCPGAVVATEGGFGFGSASVSYGEAQASDNVAVAAVGCSPPRGSAFGVGTSNVTCTASDAAGNEASCVFTVDVASASAPPLVCPAAVSVSDGGRGSAAVAYAAPANASCSLASGSEVGIGERVVVCRSTDGSGQACSFVVRVLDTTAPTVTCPADVSVATETGAASAAVAWAAPAVEDNDARGARVVCDALSGSRFSLGNTTVTCTALDASGNEASCTFAVEVSDAEAPRLACPVNAEAVLAFGLGRGAALWPEATATDNVGVAGSVSCSPASGSEVGLGSVSVECTAQDAAGNEGRCTHTLAVVPGDVDCVGAWSAWSGCAACPSRVQLRTFEVEIAPTADGVQCAGDEETRACVEAPPCRVLSASFTLSPADASVLTSNATLRAAFAAASEAAVYDALVGEGVDDLVVASDVSVTSVSTAAAQGEARRRQQRQQQRRRRRRRDATGGSVTVDYEVDVEAPEAPRVRTAMEGLHNNTGLLSALQQARFGLGDASSVSHTDVAGSGEAGRGTTSATAGIVVAAVFAVLVVVVVVFVVHRRRQDRRVGASGGGRGGGEKRLSKQGLVSARTSATASTLEGVAGAGGISAYQMDYTNPVSGRGGGWTG